MKQQAQRHGIIWREDLIQPPKDYIDDVFIKKTWSNMESEPLGKISKAHWQSCEDELLKQYIHRPHDALINSGYEGITDTLVNALNVDSNQQPKRKVFNNA
ncbi:hypothetical protein D9U34_22280 [Vibrio anguillarum]|nr:hypothetical protein [Vibrio anguillarum]RMZ61819.1 hypothetical protein D9U34_22280 [Vibrio anguillarum]